MDQGPLVTEQIEAGAKLANEFAKYAPLQAAFWLKGSEDGEWYFYLVSDQINDQNFDLAYREVIRLFGRGPHLWLDPFQVKVAGVDNDTAKDVIDIQTQYPVNIPFRLRNRRLGNTYIEEVFIYPIPTSVPS